MGDQISEAEEVSFFPPLNGNHVGSGHLKHLKHLQHLKSEPWHSSNTKDLLELQECHCFIHASTVPIQGPAVKNRLKPPRMAAAEQTPSPACCGPLVEPHHDRHDRHDHLLEPHRTAWITSPLHGSGDHIISSNRIVLLLLFYVRTEMSAIVYVLSAFWLEPIPDANTSVTIINFLENDK